MDEHQFRYNQVRYVPRKISHHGQHAGYDIIFDRLGLKKAYSPMFAKISQWIPEFFSWRLRQMRPQESGKLGLGAEVASIPWVFKGKGKICHFIYGEDTYFFTPLWKTKKNKIIATYHYPPERLCQRVSPGAVKSLDALVIVGTNQKAYFSKIISEDKVHFVPHHVDTDFFTPIEKEYPNDVKRGIFVGNCMRDFETLLGGISKLELSRQQVHFDLILPEDKLAMFASLSNVTCHNKIEESDFLRLYQNADFGVMPMTDCTANNSVLEMMSCALPVIVSNVGGISDYLNSDGALFFEKKDVAGFASAIEAVLMMDDDRLKKMGAANRIRAVDEFSLDVISKRMALMYQSILNE